MKRRSMRWLLGIALATGTYQQICINRLHAADYSSFPLAAICQINDSDALVFDPALPSGASGLCGKQSLVCVHDSTDQATWISRQFAKWAAECNLSYSDELDDASSNTFSHAKTVVTNLPLDGEAPAPATKLDEVAESCAPVIPYEEYVPYDLSIIDREYNSCFTYRPIGSMSAFRPKRTIAPFNDETLGLPTKASISEIAEAFEGRCWEESYSQSIACPEGSVCQPPYSQSASSESPSTIVQDEVESAFEGLDADWREQIVRLYRDLTNRGMRVFEASHIDSIASLAERWMVGCANTLNQFGIVSGKIALENVKDFEIVDAESVLPVQSYPLADGGVLVTPRSVTFEPIADETANQLEACFPVHSRASTVESNDTNIAHLYESPDSQYDVVESELSSDYESQFDRSEFSANATETDDTAMSYGVGIDNALVDDTINDLRSQDQNYEPLPDELADAECIDAADKMQSPEVAQRIESCPMAIVQQDDACLGATETFDATTTRVDEIALVRELGYSVIGRISESMHGAGNWLQTNAKWLDKFNREIIANKNSNVR